MGLVVLLLLGWFLLFWFMLVVVIVEFIEIKYKLVVIVLLVYLLGL